MVGVGVLAHVHRGELQAERGDACGSRAPAARARSARRGARAASRARSRARRAARRRRGSRARLVRAPARPAARACATSFCADAGELEPVGLLGVEAPVARARAPAAPRGRAASEASSSGGGAGDAHRVRQVAAQLVDQRQRVADAVLVLEGEHVAGDVGVTLGLPSRSPPIQVPKVSGRASTGSSTPSRSSSAVSSSSTSGTASAVQLVEVVDGVAGLVDHVGPRDAQLVGLPEQVDQLLEPPVDAALGGGVAVATARSSSRPATSADLVEHRAAGGLGGVGGEDRAHAEARELARRAPRRSTPAAAMRSDGLRQPAAALAARIARAARGRGAPARRRWPGGSRW